MGNGIVANVFFMLGGIAVMMFGMRIMGSNLEQVAGNNMKKMLGKMTSNRFAGVGIGACVTAIINSSAATTVMLVGFVNVGLMTLAQATSVIMGANIGTTITAQVLSLSGAGGFDVAAVAAIVAAVGTVLALFVKKDKINKTGYILLGVGMIFLGLKILSVSVDEIIYDGGVLRNPFDAIFQGEHFPLLLILIGIVITALIQSSAATTGILIALGSALSFKNAVFIILGSNIGTCVTALISSIGTSTNARRTAIIHLLFNLFGCVVCIAPLWIFGDEFSGFMATISGPSTERQIANFHTLFNLGTTLILLPFTKVMVMLAEKLIPEKKTGQEEKHKLTFIDDLLLETPPIAVENTKKEIIKMAEISKENINLSIGMLLDAKVNNAELIRDNEEALNFLNKNIVAFLSKLIHKEISAHDDKVLGTYYHVVSDIERIGDYCENILEYSEKMRKEDLSFSKEAVEELKDMVNSVNMLFDSAMKTFVSLDLNGLAEIDVLEQDVDNANNLLESKHIERLKQGNCDPQTGSVFLQTISHLERVGDHITNIAFSIKQYKK